MRIRTRSTGRFETVKTVAGQIVETEKALSLLNLSEQVQAFRLAGYLIGVSTHLASLKTIKIIQFKERKMRKLLAMLVFVLLLGGCGKPQDIVFGPEPLKQISEQGDQFRKLPEEDRGVLVGYLMASEMGRAFGAEVKPATGRTVGEVLADAKAWKEKMAKAEAEAKIKKEQAAAEAKKQEEAAATLKAKALAERKAISDQISASVVVAVIDKKVLPKDYNAGRYTEMLTIKYAIENKSNKAIRQLKGRVVFRDMTGDMVGNLSVDFDEPIGAGKSRITDTGRGWRINSFMNGEIEKIASREFGSMKASFEPESIAFDGGEVLKAPDL